METEGGVAPNAEELLILRLEMQRRIRSSEWEGAASICAIALPQLVVADWTDMCATREAVRELALLCDSFASLGLAAETEGLSQVLVRVLSQLTADSEVLTMAARALKLVVAHEWETFTALVFKPKSDGIGMPTPSVALLATVVAISDAHTCARLVAFPSIRAAVEQALRGGDTAAKVEALKLVASMVLKAPIASAKLVHVLLTAFSVERPPLRYFALALLFDAAYALAQAHTGCARSEAEAEEAERELDGFLTWAPTLLHSARVEEQTIAVLGLGKLVLHRLSDDSLFSQCIDAEALVAELAYRYTAPNGLVPTTEQSAKWPLLQSLGDFFACIAVMQRNDLCNSITWVLLESLERGGSTAVEEPRTLRCVRYLARHLDNDALQATAKVVRLNMYDLALSPSPSLQEIMRWLVVQ